MPIPPNQIWFIDIIMKLQKQKPKPIKRKHKGILYIKSLHEYLYRPAPTLQEMLTEINN